MTRALAVAAFLAALGLLHLLLPDSVGRWRSRHMPAPTARSGIRLLGAGLLGLAMLVAVLG